MKQVLVVWFSISAMTACSQNPIVKGPVGAPCEGCEAIYECPVAFEQLPSVIELPDWNDKGPKLIVNGIVYQSDGKTPAPNVVIYIYHTNQVGVYPSKGNEKGWAKRHGYIRGWVKTNEKGEYTFKTLRPAPYPNAGDPAHIHVTVKEPTLNEYWIDEYLFDDDPLLDSAKRKKLDNRGGSGIIRPISEDGVARATRNIILGKNIPAYPTKK